MLEIGLLALDTSHPERFADVLTSEFDAEIAAVWDDGDVRDEAYVAAFCEEYGATRYDDPAAMVDAVDATMVLSVNWDRHRPLAVPFLEAGVPTFVDKPVAGSAADAAAIDRAAREGDAPLFGGSAVPYHPSLDPLRADDATRTTWAAGYNSPFYYGVHLVDTVRTLAGGDWETVEPAAGHDRAVTATFGDGSVATLQFDGPTEDAAFGFLDVASRTRSVTVGSTTDALDAMYRPFLEAFLEVARGERDDRERLVDAATLLLGAQAALESGERVAAGSEALEEVAMDGAAFTETYEPYY